jgi:copper chaperone CopZ
MTIDGITCAHCVKIVETVLKGCPGNRSPIDGLIDAVADRDMNFVLIKVEKTADARRIAFEAARNLSMVGYTAKARSLDIQRVGKSGRGAAAAVGSEGGGSDDMTLQSMCAAFDAVPNVNPMLGDFFHWNSECCCPDNTISRNGCPRCVIEGYCMCAFLLITTVADSSSRLSFTLQTLSNGTWHLEDV